MTATVPVEDGTVQDFKDYLELSLVFTDGVRIITYFPAHTIYVCNEKPLP